MAHPTSTRLTRRRWLGLALGASASLCARHASAQTGRTLWIDVRTPAEYASGHLPGALNIPLNVIEQHIARHVPDKNAPIALYCRSGNRSGHAHALLQRMGYTRVRNEGGYADLKRRGVKAE